MTITTGIRLGSYQVLTQIGAGGMGEVYQAHDTKLDRSASKYVTETNESTAVTTSSVPAGAMLDTWSNAPWTNGVQIEEMEDMQKLFVQTKNSLYEITVIDRWSGEILVRGGHLFPGLTPAQLAGATLWGSLLKIRGIYVGFAMEINAGDQRFLTTRVREIAVETPDAHRF